MKYQVLRDALAKNPTAGPWSFKRHTSSLSGEHTKTDDWTIYGANGNAICFEGNAPELADPEYIATVDPDTLRALLADADRADALEKVLIDLMNSTGGGKKACGHSFTCGCAWKAARTALSQGEQT